MAWVVELGSRIEASLTLARARLLPPTSERHPLARGFAWGHLALVVWLAVAQLSAFGAHASAFGSQAVAWLTPEPRERPVEVAFVPVRRLASPRPGVLPEAQGLTPSPSPPSSLSERAEPQGRPPCLRCAGRGS